MIEIVNNTPTWLFQSKECNEIENVRHFFLAAPDACCFITSSVMCLTFTTCPFTGPADLLFLDFIFPGSGYMVLVGKPKGRGNLEDLDLDERMILKWILRKQDGSGCTGFIWLRVGTASGLF
jgi:hypothetical protein